MSVSPHWMEPGGQRKVDRLPHVAHDPLEVGGQARSEDGVDAQVDLLEVGPKILHPLLVPDDPALQVHLPDDVVCRVLIEKKKKTTYHHLKQHVARSARA